MVSKITSGIASAAGKVLGGAVTVGKVAAAAALANPATLAIGAVLGAGAVVVAKRASNKSKDESSDK